MSRFLEAAYLVLKDQPTALSADDIAKLALERGLLRTTGRTPAASMKARLSTEILTRQSQSRFIRTDSGLFGLRERGSPEFIAPRFRPSPFDEDVVVFPAERLRTHVPRIGLNPGQFDGRRLLADCSKMRRRNAEENKGVIQLVSAFVVRYGRRFLTFQRTKRLPEGRLHGYYSMHFGGHLNPSDVGNFVSLFDPFDPEQTSDFMLRELQEELVLEYTPQLKRRGLIYDDSREVSSQHLAIVYDVELQSPSYAIGERGFLINDKLEDLSSMKARFEDFENWSQLLISAEMDP